MILLIFPMTVIFTLILLLSHNLTVIANIKFWYQIYNNQSLNLNDAFFNELIDCLKLRQLLNKKCIHLSSGEEKKLLFLSLF